MMSTPSHIIAIFVAFTLIVLFLIDIKKKEKAKQKKSFDLSRRKFLSTTGTIMHDEGIHAINKKVVKGVSAVTGKRSGESKLPNLPAGAISLTHMKDMCNACMACVEVCEQHLLEPSLKLGQGMLPVLSFRNGYCKPSCTLCNNICPTSALTKISSDEKQGIQIGHAIWVRENCIAIKGETCRKCEEACQFKCIEIIQSGRKSYPIVNSTNCTGCGACEFTCPASPLKGIYVEALSEHVVIENYD